MPVLQRTQTGCAKLPVLRLSLLLLVHSTAVKAFLPFNYTFPTEVTYHASVMTNVQEQAKPLAYYDENYVADEEEPFQQFRGFQPDLLRAIVKIAKDLDNITVTFELEEAPLFSYDEQFNYMANDCNHTVYKGYAIPKEDCDRLDLIVGDFYTFPWRSIRAPYSPTLLNTAGGALQYVRRKKRQIATLEQAQALQEPVCLLDNSHYNKAVMEKYPNTNELECFTHEECVAHLKAEECALFVDDDLQLKYMVVQDIDLRMAPESIAKQDIAWPFHHAMAPEKMQLLIRWILEAKRLEILENLYQQYFSVAYCPIGKAGKYCNRPCSPTNGLANREGVCICDSNRWTGPDCETEVLEELNLIPPALKVTSYAMIGINFSAVAISALWLYRNRATAQVQVAQPIFLNLILLGCLISTSTIFALTQEDEGDGPVRSCMAIPWLYSVGFCITFGTLLAKIRRVWLLFVAAAQMQRTRVTAAETFCIIGLILLVDVIILTVWTIVDPLEWQRTVSMMDKYSMPLESEGYCVSEHWTAFAVTMAIFHLFLLISASYLCYRSRELPTRFSEGRFLSIAMVSNLQIFIVGVPILIIVGNDPKTSFFVRSVMIFLNDLAVIVLIFGNLMWSVYEDSRRRRGRPSTRNTLIRNAMKSYRRKLEVPESLKTVENAGADTKSKSAAATATSQNTSACDTFNNSFGFSQMDGSFNSSIGDINGDVVVNRIQASRQSLTSLNPSLTPIHEATTRFDRGPGDNKTSAENMDGDEEEAAAASCGLEDKNESPKCLDDDEKEGAPGTERNKPFGVESDSEESLGDFNGTTYPSLQAETTS